MSKFQELSSLIWSVADDVLRGLFKLYEEIPRKQAQRDLPRAAADPPRYLHPLRRE